MSGMRRWLHWLRGAARVAGAWYPTTGFTGSDTVSRSTSMRATLLDSVRQALTPEESC